MGGLADMLAHGEGEDAAPADEETGDPRAMGEASIKAMFEAAKSGDYAAAFDHLCSASEHAEMIEGDEPSGGDSPMSHKPALLIGIHK